MLHSLLAFDTKLFLLINSGMANPVMDYSFPYITQFKFWIIPLSIPAAVYIRKTGKRGLLTLFLGLILIGISDPLCVRVLKPLIGRHRPCDPGYLVEGGRFLMGNLRSLSWPSAHAMNFFAVSAFFSLLYPRFWLIFFMLASLIGFTRVYLGVHYPLDVFGGALLGMGLGFGYGKLTLLLFSRWMARYHEEA